MQAMHRRTMITCLGITQLLLAMSPLARKITATEISRDPRATYLRTNQDPGALATKPIDLSSLSIVPGNVLRLERLGDFDCGAPCMDDRIAMIGVFSASSTLLSADQPDRVPGAIEAGQDIVTGRTNFGSLPTDIPEDFSITDTIIVAPVGATHLFITAHDSLYYDNTDPDGDFAVRVTVVRGVPGDYNDNGVVEAADYIVWRKYEEATNVLPNDLIGGMIGAEHYNQWRTYFGLAASGGRASGNSGSENAAVAEPAVRLLWLSAVAFVGFGRRRIAQYMLFSGNENHD